MYRIRFHGRGGQGIKTAAQVLGTAFFREGYEVQDAPRYGAERRGAPIFAYVRAARTPIHERGVITRPDLVIVADETLVAVPAAGVLQGVTADTVVLMASKAPGGNWRERLNLAGPVLTIPGQADESGAAGFVGVACAGAAARVVGALSRDRLAGAVIEEIGKFGAAAVERDCAAGLAAFDAMGPHGGIVREGAEIAATGYAPPEWIDVTVESAGISAPSIHAAATSALAKTGSWRTLRPVIDYELCNRCSWVCSTLCPDSAIDVAPDRTPAIDYDHCKGCMVCVAVCPPHAIRAVSEQSAATEEART
jgi:pyruvate ferredoxin oxidoreductase gamma subunit